MISFVTPHLHVRSVLDLQANHLRELGLEGLLLDVDCTLKDFRAIAFRDEISAWVRNLVAADVRLCLLSNGHEKRIGPLAQSLSIPFVAKAFKPFPFGCYRGIKTLGLPQNKVALAGDQLFADILAGRLAGLRTILVQPTTTDEPWFTRVKRPLERRTLRWLNLPIFEIPPSRITLRDYESIET